MRATLQLSTHNCVRTLALGFQSTRHSVSVFRSQQLSTRFVASMSIATYMLPAKPVMPKRVRSTREELCDHPGFAQKAPRKGHIFVFLFYCFLSNTLSSCGQLVQILFRS